MIDLVRTRLGDAQAALHTRLLALLETAAGAAAPAVRAVIADLLCGMFHDHRSSAPMPKAELVDRLAATCAPGADELCADVLAGRFADAAPRPGAPAPGVPRTPAAAPPAIALSPPQAAVFAWLHRYHEVYGRGPSLAELASGLSMPRGKARRALLQLQRRGAARTLGGARGWYPTRAP